MKQTQADWVKARLRENGEITRNQCLQNFISRLGAIMCDLKAEGWEFTTERRNGDYVYKLVDFPKKIVRRVDNDSLPPIKVDGRWVPQTRYVDEVVAV